MAIRATGETRGADRVRSCHLSYRAGICVAEENASFQFFPRAVVPADLRHLRLHEILQLGRGDPLFGGAEFRVLLGQTSQERAHMLGAAVRHAQFRIVHIELERVATLAILLVGNFQVIDTRRVRLVAIRAIEFVAVQRGNIRRRKMEGVIEFQFVRIFQLFGEHLEFRVVRGEAVDDLGVTTRRTRRFE